MTTIGKVEKTSEGFLWQIGDIFTLKKDRNYSSPSFSFADNDWNLSIERENKIDCINVNLRKLPNFPPISIEYCMILKMLDGKKDKEYCRCDIDEIKLESGCYRSISIPESFVRETEQVPSYVLAVLCTLKLPKPIGFKNDVALTQVYKNVLLNGKNHDLILKIGEKELRAHKDILRARSHVFESMLDHDMKEKRSGVIDMPDCDPEAMELFLSYVYCGKVETQDQNSMIGLYYIADKYDMKGLKEECSDIIRKSLSKANICEVIQLALKHSDSRLLEYSTEYFISNALDIMRTVEWQIFLKDNTTVGNELLIKSLEKKNNILSHKSVSSDIFCGSLDDPFCPIKKKSASSDTFCGFIDDYAYSVKDHTLQLKYDYQDDNTAETTQDKRDKNRTKNISSYLPEKAIETLRLKYDYQDDNTAETTQDKRDKNRTKNIFSYPLEKAIETLRLKYDCLDDNTAETTQDKRDKNRTKNISSYPLEKAIETLRLKYDCLDDNTAETTQDKRDKNRTKNISSYPLEKAIETLRLKYDCLDDNTAETTQDKRDKNRTKNISSYPLEKAIETLRLKYDCLDDNTAETTQDKRDKNRTKNISSYPLEKAIETLRLKYDCLYDYTAETTQDKRDKNRTKNISSYPLEKAIEVPPVNGTYIRQCPKCLTPNEKRFGHENIKCTFCFFQFH